MNKDTVVTILAQVAQEAAAMTSATHPEDIAAEMAAAIGHAAITLEIVNRR